MFTKHHILRGWLIPAIFVCVAALLTWPWTLWVVEAAYERDVNEKSDRIAQRVKIHLSNPIPWTRQEQVLDPLKAELLGDQTVQAVAFLDYSKRFGAAVRRNNDIPVPRSLEDVKGMLNANPQSYRRSFVWEQNGEPHGIIYLDLSIPELRKNFWRVEWPLIKKVGWQTFIAFLVVSGVGILAYRFWGSAERQRQRAELEQQGQLAERGLAAAVLAHEIRNPLAALRFQLHSLRRHAGQEDRVASTADTIDNELVRIQQLLQDYLAHEKAQAMRITPVDLVEAAQNLQVLMQEMLRESGAKMIINPSVDHPIVVCDPHALRQILINLVINAQQAMGKGGTITINIAQADGFGAISVSDTGPGIPPEMRDQLFKPFATSKKDGSGIGLALVKRFVDNFGGSISVESEPGHGATFHLKLPLARANEPANELPANVKENLAIDKRWT
ncbi:MAG TPA: HAMP domain-containing sensor histidine kinase [Tepidisphaeraceae bacterium]|nr:HAMP domain-containing sensor histidine kinase [Tepidisphaeraceae bacterium]